MTSVGSLNFKIGAPGKVILFGEHSVVYGKTAVAGSVNLKTKLSFSVASFSSAKDISLHLPNIGLHVAFDLKKLCKKLIESPLTLQKNTLQCTVSLETPEKINFNKLLEKVEEFIKKSVQEPLTPVMQAALTSFLCVLTGMFSIVDVPLVSSFIEVTSQIPIGAGMGSSTAYNVCLAAAFLNYIRIYAKTNLPLMKHLSRKGYKPFEYWDVDTMKFDNDELDLISRWALVGDKVMHGNPSGIDNAVCTFGRLVEFKKGERSNTLKKIPDPKHLNLLLVNTKVPRDTKMLVDLVASRRDRFCTVIDPILDSMDSVAITAAGVLRRVGQLTCVCDDKDTKMTETITDEIEKLEELVDINQKLLESVGVSHDSLEFICQASRERGLHAKLTGAGGGGFAFVILPHKIKSCSLEDLLEIFQEKGFPVYKIILGGPGVCILDFIGEMESEVEVESVQEEYKHESPPSIPSYQGFHPETSHDLDIDSSIHQPDTVKPWPGPVNYEKLVTKMLNAQKHVKKKKDVKVPVETVPPRDPQWKENLRCKWGPLLEEFEKLDRSAKHKKGSKDESMSPIEEILWEHDNYSSDETSIQEPIRSSIHRGKDSFADDDYRISEKMRQSESFPDRDGLGEEFFFFRKESEY